MKFLKSRQNFYLSLVILFSSKVFASSLFAAGHTHLSRMMLWLSWIGLGLLITFVALNWPKGK